jgi:hypothetical protein
MASSFRTGLSHAYGRDCGCLVCLFGPLQDFRLVDLRASMIGIECHMRLILLAFCAKWMQMFAVSNLVGLGLWKISVWSACLDQPRPSDCMVYAPRRASCCQGDLQAWHFHCLAPSPARMQSFYFHLLRILQKHHF